MSGSHNLFDDSYNLFIHVIHGNPNWVPEYPSPLKKDTYLMNKKQTKL